MNPPRVFIYYSKQDWDWARAFAEALNKQDVEVWLDRWAIGPGQEFYRAFEKGLRESEVIALVVSRADAKNPDVSFISGAALGGGKRLIPIVPEDLDFALLPYPVRALQSLAKGPPEETAQMVADAVKAIPGIKEGP